MSVLADVERVDESWRSWTGAHGGLLAGIALDHAGRLVSGLPARAVHVSFLSAVRSDEVHVSADLVKAGRSSSTVIARLQAGEKLALLATATFGGGDNGPGSPAISLPDVPDVDTLAPFTLPPGLVPFAQHIEFRPVGGVPLSGGDSPVLTSWVRLVAPPARPESAATVLLDVLAPALYATRTTPVPIPTVELAVHFTEAAHTFDANEWAFARIHTEHASAGWCVDASEVWNRAGELVATGRQTRRILQG
ncbi:acyl-CoA thioesterase [Actinokineospora terrae]|uniref:Acyl-CoA thioesterase n=1 Tax=Actinokineospora terrae TaxID=155974 RepID=A0A1H9S554_9PSEU|nr:thioesterase family protein [Actinokineospora terrae]SER80162.1 Acyl-CoA thioesterase [Actinokineospora terrae]